MKSHPFVPFMLFHSSINSHVDNVAALIMSIGIGNRFPKHIEFQQLNARAAENFTKF